jgi:hypothetical protein
MLALKDQCLHPTTNKPYVKSAVGGSDNSPEGLQVRSYSSRETGKGAIRHKVLIDFCRMESPMLLLSNSRTIKTGSSISRKIQLISDLLRVLGVSLLEPRSLTLPQGFSTIYIDRVLHVVQKTSQLAVTATPKNLYSSILTQRLFSWP